MKTTTYLRLSLLTPFLVWGICVLFFLILGAAGSSGLTVDESTILGIMLWAIVFYVFGIIGWFLPYLLLSLVLLVWSFRARAEVLMKVFALSPVAMAILVVLFLSMISFGSQDWSMFVTNPLSDAENFFGSPLWFVILTLIWGYACVGAGFGIYKTLQRRGFIKDDAVTASMPLPEPS
jgi:hypothetical protein